MKPQQQRSEQASGGPGAEPTKQTGAEPGFSDTIGTVDPKTLKPEGRRATGDKASGGPGAAPPKPITIDGALGEGGGQMLRSNLSMAAITGRETEIINIRAGRAKPGLKRQHLTAVRAAAEVCGGTVSEVDVGSSALQLSPQGVTSGSYTWSIGSGGSCCLVLQTVLPIFIAYHRDNPGHETLLTIYGGTHVPFAPSFTFIKGVYVPALQAMGIDISVELKRGGYMQRGGGCLQCRIGAVQPRAQIEWLSRGSISHATSSISNHGLPEHVAEREWKTISDGLKKSPWRLRHTSRDRHSFAADGIGNYVDVFLHYDNSLLPAHASSCGQQGKPAEKVATEALRELRAFHRGDWPITTHLADQLLLPLALTGGGQFRTGPLSLHSRSNMAVLGQFGVECRYTNETTGDGVVVTVLPFT